MEWAPQFDVDEGLARRLIAGQFPELRAGSIVRFGAGMDNLAYLVDNRSRDRRCIVHGDVYARHLLVDDRHRLTGVIDWGDVHVGDPALDLMAAFSMLPPRAYREFKAAYGGVDEQTWMLAKYRAVYHGALVTHFGMQINDAALRDAGLAGLRLIRETL